MNRLMAAAALLAGAELDAPAPRPWWRRASAWAGALMVLALGVGLYTWQQQRRAAQLPSYVTVAVKRGGVTLGVTANGTLQPTRAVNIGSELSGTVARVLVDVNDQVHAGQVLVQLDTAKLQDQIVRARAALAAARADQAQTQAGLAEAQLALGRLEEVARLSGGKVPSGAELDAGRATLSKARAAVLSAAANVQSAQAALSTDSTNLARASIRAPVDGVVLSRSVDPGNAVAASLQAVTLFALAEDLRHLRLLVNVDEADVGAVRAGQPASFSVSAYPERSYPAVVTRVSYGSTITENVVTYVAYLEVDNADLSLRPGMTATAVIRAAAKDDVLLIPNSALRFTPADAPAAASGLVARLMPRLPGRAPRPASAAGRAASARRSVWLFSDGVARERTVTLGITDGRYTEVNGDGLQPGMLVITDQRAGTP